MRVLFSLLLLVAGFMLLSCGDPRLPPVSPPVEKPEHQPDQEPWFAQPPAKPPADWRCPLEDRLSVEQCTRLWQMRLPAQLPPARGNAHGDDLAAAQLGQNLFYRTDVSTILTVGCFGCHLPEEGFDDGRPHSENPGGPFPHPLGRNSPTLLNAAWMRWQLWDGKADTLWAQPLFAIESTSEMQTTRLTLAHTIRRLVGAQYADVFGYEIQLPTDRFPEYGMPGNPEFDNMAPADQVYVNRIAANVGKALEAFMRKLAGGPSAVDRFIDGDASALSSEAQRGAVVFFEAGCVTCHHGPMLSDERFHNLGVGALPGAEVDQGRHGAFASLTSSPFNSQGPFYDGPRPAEPWETTPPEKGAFRTPPLRNLGVSAPYGHNGRFATLAEVVDFHLEAKGHEGQFMGELSPLLEPQVLSTEDKSALLAFLMAFEGVRPGLPWTEAAR